MARAHDKLWLNENTGEISCGRDGGSYLFSAIEAAPDSSRHVTPLGTWLRVDMNERLAAAKDGFAMVCESRGRCEPDHWDIHVVQLAKQNR